MKIAKIVNFVTVSRILKLVNIKKTRYNLLRELKNLVNPMYRNIHVKPLDLLFSNSCKIRQLQCVINFHLVNLVYNEQWYICKLCQSEYLKMICFVCFRPQHSWHNKTCQLFRCVELLPGITNREGNSMRTFTCYFEFRSQNSDL